MARLRVLGAALPLLLLAGCGPGGSLKVTKISSQTEKPSNLTIFMDVQDKTGRPIPGLAEKNFRIYEDGKLVPESKGRRALLDPRILGVRYALLLIDMSGPIVDSEDMPELASAVGRFVDRVGATQQVAVAAFDGSEEIAPFMGFGATVATAQVIESLRQFRPRNRSTNLNGAVFQGLHMLKEQLEASKAEKKAAALVVFTDRGDLSHSVSPEVLKAAVRDSPAEVYLIGAGERINHEELTAIGRNGVSLSNDPKAYKKGFDEAIRKLTSFTEGKYALAYCSPKRKGSHKLEVEVVASKDRGRLQHKFSAQGFRSGCVPKSAEKAPPSEDKDSNSDEGAGDADSETTAKKKEPSPASRERASNDD